MTCPSVATDGNSLNDPSRVATVVPASKPDPVPRHTFSTRDGLKPDGPTMIGVPASVIATPLRIVLEVYRFEDVSDEDDQPA